MSMRDAEENTERPGALSSPERLPLSVIALLIPAWQPTSTLSELVADLAWRGFGAIIVVDDGSGDRYHTVFEELAKIPQIELLRQPINFGKGRALKTGFRHLLNSHPEFAGVVTADADGQHTPEDIERIAHALLHSGGRAVLGARRFERIAPLRSRLGNVLTRSVFSFVAGTRLTDTQTGLRGLPLTVLPQLLELRGERYEYEMAMLAHLCRSHEKLLEIPIATIYIENNRGSHFNPVWDSLRIYFVLLRFYAASLWHRGRPAGFLGAL